MTDLSLLTTYGELLVSILLLACLVGLVFQVRKLTTRLHAQDQHMEDLQGAVAAYGQSLVATRSLVERLGNRLGEFTDRNLEIQSQFAFNRSFEEASRLVKDGTTVDSLVNDCGLSDAEAALMIRLHQKDEEKPRQQWRAPDYSPVIDRDVSRAGERTQIANQLEASSAALNDQSTLTSEEIRLKESLAAAQSR